MNPTVLTSTIHKHSLSQTHVMIKVIIIQIFIKSETYVAVFWFPLQKRTKKPQIDMKDLTIEEWSFLPLEKLHHLTVENGLANTIILI